MKKIFLLLIILPFLILPSLSQNLSKQFVKDSLRQFLNSTIKTPEEKVSIQFVGTGEIQKSINEGKEIPATTGIGLYFQRNFRDGYKFLGISVKRIELEVIINIASNVDSLKAEFNTDKTVSNTRDFGNYILYPMSSGQSTFINYRMDFPSKPFGLECRVIASNRVWDSLNRSRHASCLAIRAGGFYEFMPKWVKSDDYSVILGLNLNYRRIAGDISQKENDNFREAFLKTKTKSFYGLEPHIILRLKNISAEVSYIYLWPNGNDVPGMTRGQLMTSIRFVGGFPIDLSKKVEE